ncbi:AMP-binding protein [Sorangium sp. So ce1036]|uniref:phenylacetate--CoA ligase family protein n=1 Tax=Sorangium sp. So ce1036 TaxID=3133328 RepID=UPI003F1059B5
MTLADQPTRFDPSPLRRAYAAMTSSALPLRDHPLYGTVERFEDARFLTPAALSEFTERAAFACDVTQLEVCPACFFQTSGSTGRSKRIPYSERDLEKQADHEATAFRKLGLSSRDVVLSLGSPPPSISAWAIANGSRRLGATVLNGSHVDYELALEGGRAEEVTTLFATPLVALAIGRAIAEEQGDPRRVFPRLRRAILFGDTLPRSLRREVRDLWGVDRVLALYGTVEADVVATELPGEQGELDPMLEELLIELLPEEELRRERLDPSHSPAPVRVADLPPGDVVGEILLSDLRREALPIVRYRIGDIVRVRAREGGRPTLSVLGRSKSTVFIDGAPIYEMALNQAIEEALGGAACRWQLTAARRSGGPFDLVLEQPPGAAGAARAVLDAIAGAVVPREIDVARHFRVSCSPRLPEPSGPGDLKAARVVVAS